VVDIMDDKKLFTSGQFAKMAGITIRALRYYDKIDLLKPTLRNDSGHRMYSDSDFGVLQKILTLKFIGLSLDEIKEIVKYDVDTNDFKNSLGMQKDIIHEKMQHMSLVIRALDQAKEIFENERRVNWDLLINIIKVINSEKSWVNQYKDASALRARINLHDKFSTNKQGWHSWIFEQLRIPPNAAILELGCGDGSLWSRNMNLIPKDSEIILTDFSEGMLEDARKNLNMSLKKFIFKSVDASNIPFDDNKFDIVIANHMLYHVHDVSQVLHEINRVLKPCGTLYTSTIGKNNLIEMAILSKEFDDEINLFTDDFSGRFGMENGNALLKNYFSNIVLKNYEDSMVVTEAKPLLDYILSIPLKTNELLSETKIKKFEKFIQQKILKTGGIHITKEAGLFISKKIS
jgi:ubiquinone/menaquinone biosynthesis C-methylase UbiE/DNA-binding transcriptional MerR regulator